MAIVKCSFYIHSRMSIINDNKFIIMSDVGLTRGFNLKFSRSGCTLVMFPCLPLFENPRHLLLQLII